MSNFFFNALWPGLTVWTLLYISDYAFTITCARLYRAGVGEKLALEGSYEITPYFQRDIDSLRRISPRFLAMLVLGAGMLTVLWLLARQSLPGLYSFSLGSMVLVQLAVHVRHIRNLVLFRAIISTDAVRGRIEYSRPLMLRMSAFELLTFSCLFFLLFCLHPIVVHVGRRNGVPLDSRKASQTRSQSPVQARQVKNVSQLPGNPTPGWFSKLKSWRIGFRVLRL